MITKRHTYAGHELEPDEHGDFLRTTMTNLFDSDANAKTNRNGKRKRSMRTFTEENLFRQQKQKNYESHHRSSSKALLMKAQTNYGMYGPPQDDYQVTPSITSGGFSITRNHDPRSTVIDSAISLRGAPPRIGSAEFRQTQHYAAIPEMARATGLRPETVLGYQSSWNHLVRFCDHPTRKYNPWLPQFAQEIFLLFAAYLYLKQDNGGIGHFATAFNFTYRQENLPEVWKGGVITETIRAYEGADTTRAVKNGKQIARLRVALPTPGLIKTLINMELYLDLKLDELAMMNAQWIVMMLCLLRADTTAGFKKGDICFNDQGFLFVTVRQVKCGKAHIQPFTKSIPPPPKGNSIATKTFELLRRAVTLSNGTESKAELTGEFTETTTKGVAARKMTKFVQFSMPHDEVGIAEGSFCASHSARITGANHGMYSARANYTTLRRWGGWKSEPAMQGYIDHDTVRCKLYADFYFWLREEYIAFEFETGPDSYDAEVELMIAFN